VGFTHPEIKGRAKEDSFGETQEEGKIGACPSFPPDGKSRTSTMQGNMDMAKM